MLIRLDHLTQHDNDLIRLQTISQTCPQRILSDSLPQLTVQHNPCPRLYQWHALVLRHPSSRPLQAQYPPAGAGEGEESSHLYQANASSQPGRPMATRTVLTSFTRPGTHHTCAQTPTYTAAAKNISHPLVRHPWVADFHAQELETKQASSRRIGLDLAMGGHGAGWRARDRHSGAVLCPRRTYLRQIGHHRGRGMRRCKVGLDFKFRPFCTLTYYVYLS